MEEKKPWENEFTAQCSASIATTSSFNVTEPHSTHYTSSRSDKIQRTDDESTRTHKKSVKQPRVGFCLPLIWSTNIKPGYAAQREEGGDAQIMNA